MFSLVVQKFHIVAMIPRQENLSGRDDFSNHLRLLNPFRNTVLYFQIGIEVNIVRLIHEQDQYTHSHEFFSKTLALVCL